MDTLDGVVAVRQPPISTLALDLASPRLRDWSRETLRQLEELGCLYEPGRCAATPLVSSRSFFDSMLDDVRTVLALARRVAVDEGGALPWARPDQAVLVQAGLQHERLPAIARPDGIVVDGQLRLLELNIDAGLGGFFEVELLQARMDTLPDTPPGQRLAVPRVMAALHGYLQQMVLSADHAHCALAIMVDDHLSPYNRSHADLLCESLNGAVERLHARVVPTSALHREGAWMRDVGGAFDIVWRFGSMAHPPEHLAASIAVQLETLRTRTRLVSSPADIGVESKLSLALLSELADDGSPTLSAMERQVVGRTVPWTRVLRDRAAVHHGERISLPHWARASRESLVLKRAHSKSSQQVVIGSEASNAAWHAALDAALLDPIPWVIQENLKSEPLPFAYPDAHGGFETLSQSYSINPFIFGQAQAAPFIRIERDAGNRRLAIANISATATTGFVVAADA
jgi:hypothetical protein